MILDDVARLVADAAAHNTLNVRTIEVYFQKSAGVDEGDGRGIQELEYRVMIEGREAQSGRTGDDGLVAVQVRPGAQTILELMWQGAPVAQYRLSLRDDPFEPDTEVLGVQRRLRVLGYQLGSAGDTGDGVDGAMGQHTDKAIQDFQIDAGQAFDSVVGQQTRNALNDQIGGSAQNPGGGGGAGGGGDGGGGGAGGGGGGGAGAERAERGETE